MLFRSAADRNETICAGPAEQRIGGESQGPPVLENQPDKPPSSSKYPILLCGTPNQEASDGIRWSWILKQVGVLVNSRFFFRWPSIPSPARRTLKCNEIPLDARRSSCDIAAKHRSGPCTKTRLWIFFLPALCGSLFFYLHV